MPPSPPLTELYDLLRTDGFAIGVDDHIRIGRLLAHDAVWNQAMLRTAVGALIVKSPAERAVFEACWERWLHASAPIEIETGGKVSVAPAPVPVMLAASDEPVLPPPEPDPRRRARLAMIAGIVAVAAALGFAWWLRKDEPVPTSTGEVTTGSGSDATDGSATTATPTTATPTTAAPTTTAPTTAAPTSTGAALPTVGSSAPAVPASPVVATPPPVTGSGSGLSTPSSPQIVAAPNPPSAYHTPPPVSSEPWLSDDELTFFTYDAFLVGSAILLMIAIAIARDARGQHRFYPGPWRYEPVIPPARNPVLPPVALEDAAAALAEHAMLGETSFDLDRSIAATLDRGGAPVVAYRTLEAPPHYVVLEDTAGGAAQWRPIYDELLRGLAREGISLERYTFHANPSTCRRANGAILALTDLIEHSDVLIVIGDGASVVPSLDGRPAPWLHTLEHIPDRLWINPLPPVRWGAGAYAIAKHTPMEHGVARALLALQDSTPRRAWHARPYPAVIDRAPDSDAAMTALEAALGEPAFHLVTTLAIATAPTLAAARWLAERLAIALDEADWLAVATLPWFRTGQWPAGVPERLRRTLQASRPDLARAADELSSQLFATSEPPAYSNAHLAWVLEASHRSARAGDRATATKALSLLAQTPIARSARRSLAGIRLFHRERRARQVSAVLGGGLIASALIFGRPKSSFSDEDTETIARIVHHMVEYRSLTAHCKNLLAIRYANHIWIWNGATETATGPLVSTTLIDGVTFSPDCSRIATRGGAQVDTWDTATRTQHTFQHEGTVVADLQFSQDNTRILSITDHGERCWAGLDTWRMDSLTTPTMSLTGSMLDSAFSPDGSSLVTIDSDGNMKRWNPDSGILHVAFNYTTDDKARFSPDSKLLLTFLSGSNIVHVWDGSTGKPTTIITPFDTNNELAEAIFSPDSSHLLATSTKGALAVWDIDTSRLVARFFDQTQSIAHAAFSPRGDRILTFNDRQVAQLWDLGQHMKSPTPISAGATATVTLPANILNAEFSPKDFLITFLCAGGRVWIWNTATGGLTEPAR